MKEFIRNVSYSFISNLISLLVGVVSVLIFPKLIGVEEFGYYQLYLFYMGYVTVTAFGLADGIYLDVGGKEYKDISCKKLGSQFWTLMSSQLLIYVVFFVLCFDIQDIDKRYVLLVVTIGAIIVHARYFLYLILQATNRIKEYAYIIITERVISVFVGLFALLMGYRGYLLLILLDVLGRFVSLLLAVWYCREIVFVHPYINKESIFETKKYLKSGSIVMLAGFSSSLVIGIVRYGVEDYWDIVTFSKVSLTISISNMVVRFINSVAVVMFPALRKIDDSKLPKIYKMINGGLMLVIFVAFVFYQPAAFLLEKWLPQYADSVKYAAILLPVCAYECKSALLVQTYLKTLRKEKMMLLRNICAMILSFVFTVFSVYILHSVELAVLSILISLMVRCLIGEIYLGKKMGIMMNKSIPMEAAMVGIFVICNWYLGIFGIGLYVIGLLIYMFVFKKDIKEILVSVRRFG